MTPGIVKVVITMRLEPDDSLITDDDVSEAVEVFGNSFGTKVTDYNYGAEGTA